MVAPKRRIKRAEVRLLSLVKGPANRIQALYKTEAGALLLESLVKYEAERGELLALGYIPNVADSHGDTANAEAVKTMAYSLMKNGAGLDVQHKAVDLTNFEVIPANVLKSEQAYVAESFIVQSGDPRFAGWKDKSGNSIDATGGWGVVVKIEDPALREQYRSGDLDGVSLFSPAAEMEPITKSDDATTRIVEATIKALQGAKETDVDVKELTTALAANNELMIAGLVKALTPPKPELKAPEPTPIVTDEMVEPVLKIADRADSKKVEKYLDDLKAYRLMKAVDWQDPEAVAAYHASITKTAEAPEQDPRVTELEAEIQSILKSSSAPANGAKKLSSEEVLIKTARSAADRINESRGFTAEKK